MKAEIKVPAMGESVTEATVSVILKANGSIVSMDEEIVELETDKVNQVLYAPQAGVLQLNISEEDTVAIGQCIGTVDNDIPANQGKILPDAQTEPVQNELKAPPPAKLEKALVPPEANAQVRVKTDAFINEVLAGPKTETPQDNAPVLTKAPAPVVSGERESRKKMSKIRSIIATRLVEAQHNAAMLTTFNEVDMSAVMSLRTKYKDLFAKQHDTKLGFMSFFVAATVAALKATPNLNAYIDGTDLIQRHYYDIGIAVGTDRGLMVPVVRDCDQLSFAGIEQSIVDYATKARKGGLNIDDLQGGSFTITNGGIYGSLLSTPILNAPQSGILGMHSIQKRPCVVNDEIVIRPMMYLALSYDHRVVDGKEAVTFLVHIKNSLEEPSRLLLNI